jgi:porphobilinogen deaminase
MYPGKNEERFINAFETWCWRRMLKIKWTDRITNDEVLQRAKEERLLLKIFKNGCHSWIGHTIRHNEFVGNIPEGAISRKKTVVRPRLQYLKQVTRNTAADSYTAMKRMACNNSRWKAANQSKD